MAIQLSKFKSIFTMFGKRLRNRFTIKNIVFMVVGDGQD